MPQTALGWHPEDIKAELRKRYGALRALCRTWGLDQGAISSVLRDPTHSIPTEMRIAFALGVRAQELWPDRWGDDGKALPRPRAERKSGPVVNHSQKERAA